MHNRFARSGLLAAVVAALLAFGAAPVGAEVAPGEDAPEVEAKAFLNIEPLKLTDLTGRLILLELFTTT